MQLLVCVYDLVQRSIQRCFNRGRKFDLVKAVGSKCVIFATFIHHADVSVSSSLLIGQYAIHFSDFERSLIAFVVETNRKL